jgi:hypothetical protein
MPHEEISPEEGLKIFLLARGVPQEEIARTIANFEKVVVKARAEAKARVAAGDITRPKWLTRSPEFYKCNAPEFMRAVYSELFDQHGKLTDEEFVRASDPKLVQAVQQYICGRKRRKQNEGDAAGIVFTTGHRGGPRSQDWRKRKHKQARPK